MPIRTSFPAASASASPSPRRSPPDRRLLIADEPTSALDTIVQAEIVALIDRLVKADGMALVFISHDIALAAGIADRIAVLRRGRLVEIGATAEIIARPRDPYTRVAAAGRVRSHPRMSPPLLELGGISKSFRRGGRTIVALDGVSLELARGETLALVGPSGSGKSTLARIVMRLVEPDREPVRGTIRFDGIDLLAARGEALRTAAGRASRWCSRSRSPPSIRAPRWPACSTTRCASTASPTAAQRPGAIAALLERVGLDPGLAGRRVHEISGGQRQRVAIARAIATRPALIVLDEAVSALDVTVRAGILALLDDLRRNENLGLLFISHDLAVVASFADRIAIMDGGRIVETGAAAAIIAAPQSATGKALVAAMPRLRIGESMQ